MRRLVAPLLAVAAVVLSASPARAGLLLHLRFDETAGVIANDSSGNGRHLQWQGSGNSWVSAGAFGGAIRLGQFGSVLARAGSAQPGTIASLNAVRGNKVSFSFWAQPTQESQGSSVFWVSDSASSPGNRIFQSHVEWTDGVIYFDADWARGTRDQRVAGTGGPTADRLHHYFMTYDGDTGLMQIYKDNLLLASTNAGAESSLGWDRIQNFEIGALSFASWWGGGVVDDFAVFDHVLGAGERDTYFNYGVAAVPEPSTLVLAALGVAGLAAARLRRRR